MRGSLLIFILFFSSFAFTQTCPTQKLTSPITPEKLQSFLKNPNVKKVEDVICCLPSEYQNNYVGIHSGFAFQAGTPDHPRVLLFKATLGSRGEQNLEATISITGDDKTLNASNHVEVMANNNGKAELFDIDFDGNHQLSGPNPKTCLGCHGPNPSELSNGGAKVIFTDAPWPYAIGFVSGFGFDNKTTSDFFSKIENHSKQQMQTQPRYSCLNKNADFAANIRAFDQISRDMNDKRVAALVLKSPDYLRYRPLIVGAGLGCLEGGVLNSTSLQHFEKDFPKWMPSDVAQRIFTDNSMIANGRQTQNFKDAYKKFLNEARDSELAARDKRRKQTDFSKTATFYPTSIPALFQSTIDFQLTTIPDVTSLKGFSPTTQLYAHYAFDSMTQHQVGDGVDPLFRFLFEGRGLRLTSWSRAMAGDYGTSLKIPLEEIKAQSANDAFWKEIGSQVDGLLHLRPDNVTRETLQTKKVVCDSLAKQSFRIFSSESSLSTSSSTSAPVQGTK